MKRRFRDEATLVLVIFAVFVGSAMCVGVWVATAAWFFMAASGGPR